MHAAVVTISTSKAAGEGTDESGPKLAELARRLGATEVTSELIPDDRELIEATLTRLCDEADCALVLTSGGTGLSPTDVTPEATRAVLEREAPGIPEAMRAASREHTDKWMLSRGAAGTRGRTLIVNFPGNPPAIEQAGEALLDPLRHALTLLAGEQPH
jgi:molybdenum cofactor synthesis domain-containing protein